jgi:hypothetical protein
MIDFNMVSARLLQAKAARFVPKPFSHFRSSLDQQTALLIATDG